MRITRASTLAAALAVFAAALLFPAASSAQDPFTFLRSFGEGGTGPGQFSLPLDVAVDDDGNAYVADTFNNRIQRFDPSGAPTGVIGAPGSEPGQFVLPFAVAVERSGSLLVADTGNARVQRIDPETGAVELIFGRGDRFSPTGIAVAPGGGAFVVDRNGNAVHRYGADGTLLEQWGTRGSGPGELQAPIDVAVAPGGGVYIADSGNDRVQRFSADGVPEGILGGLSQPQGVAVDRLGRLFVTDTGNNRIRFFDHLGAPLGGWGMPGSAPGEFDAPQGIAADCLGRIYVADAFNNRIQVFADPGAPAGGPCVPDLTQLISWARELPLRPGLRLSVVVRLVAAKRALEHDRLRPACALLRSVAWSLERFSSRGPVDGLDQLIAGVGALRGNIGCRSARSR